MVEDTLKPPFYDSAEEYKMAGVKVQNKYKPYIRKYPFNFISHERDSIGDFGLRVVVHLPIGFFIGATFPLSLPLVALLIRYEENEDLHFKDEAWKDYFGVMAGAVAGVVSELLIIFKLFF